MMNSTALLFNAAFKMSVEQSSEPHRRDTATQHNNEQDVFAQLVDNMNGGTDHAVLMVPSRSDASVSEWIAAVTMSKLALGQFATNVSKTNAAADLSLTAKGTAGSVITPLQQAVPSASQTMATSTARVISNQQQGMAILIPEQMPTSYSTKATLPSVYQRMFETKPSVAEKIAPRFIRILGAENSATLYIRDYLQSDTSSLRGMGTLLHAMGAEVSYQNVVINGINQSRKIL